MRFKSWIGMILAFVIIYSASISNAQDNKKFTVQGLGLGTSIADFRSHFEALGWKCNFLDEATFDCKGKRGKFRPNWVRMLVDQKGKAGALLINCGLTKSCNYNVDEIVDLLTKTKWFPENTIEIKVTEEWEKGYYRQFTTPDEYMSINCKPHINNCDILINSHSRYPKF